MIRHRVSVSANVPAPPAAVYDLLADYERGHPRILPPKYFRNLQVERGGRGAGTVIRFEMRLLGTTRAARAEISEPIPGRVLAETYVGNDAETTFTVVPSPEGASTRVTIATDMRVRDGIAGRLELFVTTRLLRRIYREELAILSSVVAAEKT
jgi:hypothetical protein